MGNNIDNSVVVSHNGKYRKNEVLVRIISRSALREFWENPKYQDSEQPLKSWFDEAKKASWKTPSDIKKKYGNASFVANNRVVFNIHGNKYRLVVAIKYPIGLCYIRFIGTHKQYDETDVEKI
jgi:mRNA interferase HigB